MTSLRIRPSGFPVMLMHLIFLFKAIFDGRLEERLSPSSSLTEELPTLRDRCWLHRAVPGWARARLARAELGSYCLGCSV